MIAARLKELRNTLGLSMPEFGRKLGCSRDVIANIEYGRVEPKEVFLSHICYIYGVNREWLFSGEGPMFSGAAYDQKVLEATEIFCSLTHDLQELALTQLRSLQKLTEKYSAAPAGGVQEGLDTIRLMAAMTEVQEYGELKDKSGRAVSMGEYVGGLMEARRFSFPDLAAESGLGEDELANLLDSGSGKAIGRDALIAVGLALSLDVEEMQRLLTAAGLPALYAKNRRDSACIFALMKRLRLEALQELLAELEEPSL